MFLVSLNEKKECEDTMNNANTKSHKNKNNNLEATDGFLIFASALFGTKKDQVFKKHSEEHDS